MRLLKSIAVLTLSTAINACSSSTPPLVVGLNNLNIPMVTPDPTAMNANQIETDDLHLKNSKLIKNLANILNEKYLNDVDKKDMFKKDSLTHKVYVSLTNLEEAGMVNERYYLENNTAGLLKLNKALQPALNEIN